MMVTWSHVCQLSKNYEVASKLLKYLGTNPPPTAYGPLLYGNHTVTVQVTSAITLETRTIAHQGTPIE